MKFVLVNTSNPLKPPSAGSTTNAVLKHTAIYGAANYVVRGLGIINSVALRTFMGPFAMGIWSIIQVVLDYCGYASFGTTKAMARDYPYLRGKGETQKASRLKDLVLTFSMIMSVIPAVLIGIYLTLQWSTIDPLLRVGLLFLMGFLFLQRFYDFVIVLLRSEKKFVLLSGVNILNAGVGLLVTLLLVYRWNFYGLLVGSALTLVGCLYFIYRQNGYSFNYLWNTREIFKEIKLGIPLIILTFLTTALYSMDKLIIAKFFGFFAVGVYSVAIMASTFILSFPRMFIQVLYPNLLETYGRSGDRDKIKKYLQTPVFILSVIVPALCGLAIFIFPLLVSLFLPKFVPGIPAMKVYLFGTFFLLLTQHSTNFLVVIDKYLKGIPIVLVAMLVNLALNLFFIHFGWGIRGVAFGSAVSFAVSSLGVYVWVTKYFFTTKERMIHLVEILGILAFLFGSIILIDSMIYLPNPWLSAGMKAGIWCICLIPFFLLLQKRTQLLSRLVQSFEKK